MSQTCTPEKGKKKKKRGGGEDVQHDNWLNGNFLVVVFEIRYECFCLFFFFPVQIYFNSIFTITAKRMINLEEYTQMYNCRKTQIDTILKETILKERQDSKSHRIRDESALKPFRSSKK